MQHLYSVLNESYDITVKSEDFCYIQVAVLTSGDCISVMNIINRIKNYFKNTRLEEVKHQSTTNFRSNVSRNNKPTKHHVNHRCGIITFIIKESHTNSAKIIDK